MYKYLSKKETKPYKEICNDALNKLFVKLRKSVPDSQKSFKFKTYDLVGSAKANLVTCNIDTNIFDLDYNFYIARLPEK